MKVSLKVVGAFEYETTLDMTKKEFNDYDEQLTKADAHDEVRIATGLMHRAVARLIHLDRCTQLGVERFEPMHEKPKAKKR